ncbi:LacI family DNA-binding transcriptional regulator [Salinibacterium sp. SWN1162]|uniref:LacI family DNA-binding transcriptional regulator n=1 Tax=Salinibacterium sp. SWN1162 TaxID=2792053 RepID=UPI0018CF9184|nr:LacI family DNA-binding transcriptional regulator [Salinibacterium sp. SWN1162]MBH0009711.1 LacI family DNA-binding transcriptional regulator [Salinibacterium sp. SWN1162]
MASIEDVARRAGVSTATVSRALSGNGPVSAASREKVADAAAALDYVVSSSASSLASGRTKNVGLMVPYLTRWFFTSVVEGAQQALMRHGYDVTLYNLSGSVEEREAVFDVFLQRKRIDGIVTVSLKLSPSEVERLQALDKPVVGVGGPIDGVRTLTLDDDAVSNLATSHLLSLGHTRIAHIGGSEDYDLEFHIPTNRRRGYEAALRAAGIEPQPEFFATADFTIQGGYHAAKQLLGNPLQRPTAIFASSDEMAIGCILAARDLGLVVPRDISIIGIDGHELSDFFGLTTVAQYPQAQGEHAVEILMNLLVPGKHPEIPENTPIGYDLVVRSSTSRPPQ